VEDGLADLDADQARASSCEIRIDRVVPSVEEPVDSAEVSWFVGYGKDEAWCPSAPVVPGDEGVLAR
jgi:hypothetical protein